MKRSTIKNVKINLNANEEKILREMSNKLDMSLENTIMRLVRMGQTLDYRLEKGLISKEEYDKLMGNENGLCLAHKG